jgi:hypothetical protein
MHNERSTAFGVISHLETVGDMRSIAVGNLRFYFINHSWNVEYASMVQAKEEF